MWHCNRVIRFFLAVVVLFAHSALPAQTTQEESPVAVIVIEGQDAVSTNFAPEPVQLFGAGGNLTLQLNQPALLSDAPFYADFVFLVDVPGDYTLWYGGSPPGAEDPLLASYGSPFQITIDEDEPIAVSGESVRTGPIYSTPYRWFEAGTVTLGGGEHRMRVTVDQRRRYDSRLFLYLDRFILAPVGATVRFLPDEEQMQAEPESIEDLLILLREEPSNVDAYLRLANLYTLVGDQINALRYLGRAQILDARNPNLLQAIARNTIWRSDLEGGLGVYWELVSAAPERIESFLEAGKIAAWSGFLGASEQYYMVGLTHHPDDPRLLVNLGFTYLWWNQEEQAREYFSRAERTVSSPETMLALGAEYRINGDHLREEALYREGLRRFPDSLETGKQLLAALFRQDKRGEAQDHRRAMEQRFPDAAEQLARIERRFLLLDEVIAGYEEAVREDPDNLVFRAELAQTYFWIGRREEGIRVYRNLLAAQTQQSLHREWTTLEQYTWQGVYNSLTQFVLRSYLGEITDDSLALATAVQTYRTLQQQEGADLAPAQTTIATLSARLNDATRVVATARNLYAGAVQPAIEGVQQSLETRETELAAIREQLQWEPPLRVLAEELNRADLPDNRRTARVLTTLLGTTPDLPSRPEILQALESEDHRTREALRREASVLLALTMRLSGDLAAARLWYDLEEFFLAMDESGQDEGDQNEDGDDPDGDNPDGDDPNGNDQNANVQRTVSPALLVFSELLRDPIRRRLEQSASTPSEGESPAVPINLEGAAQLAATGTELAGELSTALRTLIEQGQLFQQILSRSTELTLFYLQSNTAPERNRLGELLIDADDLDSAVVQLELVQAVDPENLATLYILAQAYRQQGRWRQARELLAYIHGRDSTSRNTIALHNEIARQYADEFWGSTGIITEPQRVETRTVAEYLWRVNSRYSIRGRVESGSVRTKIPDYYEDPAEEISGIAYLRRTAYQDFLVSAGFPIYLRPDRVTIEPVLGVRLIAHNLYYASRAGSVTEIWDGADLFGSYRVEPEPGLRWAFSTRELYLAGSYRYGTYTANQDIPLETSQLERPLFRSHTVRSDLSWNLQSRPDPIWTRYSQRTGGVAEIITAESATEGVRYRLTQEFRYGMIRRSEPFTRLGVALVTEFEDYQGEKSTWYYQPEKVFDAGTRLDWQAYRALRTDISWGVAGSLYGGYYQTRIGDGEDDPAIRTVAQLTGELSRRNVTFQLALSGSRVLSTDRISSFPDDGGYHDLGVTLAVVGRNFGLLTR